MAGMNLTNSDRDGVPFISICVIFLISLFTENWCFLNIHRGYFYNRHQPQIIVNLLKLYLISSGVELSLPNRALFWANFSEEQASS